MAEIMPYYGTLDKICKTMSMLSHKSKKNFDDWYVQFGWIAKRRKIQIALETFFKILNKEDEDIFNTFKMYEVDLVRINTLDEYRILNKILTASKDKSSIKINRLQLPLRVNENFDVSYQDIKIKPKYNEEDRKMDEEYNKTIELVEDMNVEAIESFLYLKEIKNRNIKHLDRAIWIISERINAKNIQEEVKNIKKLDITIKKLWLIFNSDESFSILKNFFKNRDLFSSLPFNSIEVYINSEFQNNIISCYYLDIRILKRNSTFIHLNPTDQIFNFKQFFLKPNKFSEDVFISGSKGFIAVDNWLAERWVLKKFRSINMKINRKNIYHTGVKIKITKWSQMMIEFNDNDLEDYCNVEEANKIWSTDIFKSDIPSLMIDPAWVERVYEKWNDFESYLRYPQIKSYKTDLFDFSNDTNIVFDIVKLNKPWKSVCLDIEGFISSDSEESSYLDNINSLRNCYFENLSIKIVGNLDEKRTENLIKSISNLRRLTKIYLIINDGKVLKQFASSICLLRKKMILTIESTEPLDSYSNVKLKKRFEHFSFVKK